MHATVNVVFGVHVHLGVVTVVAAAVDVVIEFRQVNARRASLGCSIL
jgi:hypothetical protein